MNIYEIDKAITDLIDPETGEIRDFEAFAALSMARDTKIENMALWYKDLSAEAKAIREEEKTLAERRRSAENKADHLKAYINTILAGEKYSTPRVAISWRKSSVVELDDAFLGWADVNAQHLLRDKEPEPDKAAIKEALKNGAEIQFARMVDTTSMQIK